MLVSWKGRMTERGSSGEQSPGLEEGSGSGSERTGKPGSVRIGAEYQEKAIDSLRDWSKWLIGLNFSAVTGCVIIVQQGVGPVLKPLLFGAILLFTVSVLSAALIVGMLASIVQTLPLRDDSGSVGSIYDYPVWARVSLRDLVQLQFVSFSLGVCFFLAWIALKPTIA
jgi:hypothetical protein